MDAVSVQMLDLSLGPSNGSIHKEAINPADGLASRTLRNLWKNCCLPASERLSRRPKWQVEVGCVVLSLLIAVVEYFTMRLSIVLLYGLPVSIMVWFAGTKRTLSLLILCMAFWFAAIDLKGAHPYFYVLCIIRFTSFALLGSVVSHLKDLRDNLEALADARARALVHGEAEREKLEREMLVISEREQRRIGQDLHDGFCQYLTGIAMVTHVHAQKLTQPSESDNAHNIVDKIEQAISLARGIAKGLDPIQTQSDGLMQALEEFSSTTSDLFGVRCHFECDLPVLMESPATATHLFRIAQESVCNAIKHGNAKEIAIMLEHTEHGVQLCVSDNGRGLPNGLVPTQVRGMGLRTMAIRAKLIGAQFALRPNSLGGVEMACSIADCADV